MLYKHKHQQPRLQLKDLLRRRKVTFEAWLKESHVATYAELQRWCAMIGVCAPSEDEWKALRPVTVTAPADGVVVLEALPDPPPKPSRKSVKVKKEEPVVALVKYNS